MKDSSIEKGATGERLAKKFLIDKGFEIIHCNWFCRWGEIDIIARDGDVLVFVEVKSVASDSFGRPEEWVDERKQRHIIKATMQYMMDNSYNDVPVRFDVVTVDLRKRKCHYISDAFVYEEKS